MDDELYWKLWLDDQRVPPSNDWYVARSVDDAIWLCNLRRSLPNYISFDHDLGKGPSGYDFAKWVIEMVEFKYFEKPDGFDFAVHSQNPVGRMNLLQLLYRYLK